jgi:hypothetical protein
VGEIITTVDTLVKRQIRVFALKEGVRLADGQDLQSRVMVTLFGLFAEIERELLSLRTKEAFAAARAVGKRLGRPPGARGNPDSTARSGRFKSSWLSRSPRPLSRRSRGSTAQRFPILCGREVSLESPRYPNPCDGSTFFAPLLMLLPNSIRAYFLA